MYFVKHFTGLTISANYLRPVSKNRKRYKGLFGLFLVSCQKSTPNNLFTSSMGEREITRTLYKIHKY